VTKEIKQHSNATNVIEDLTVNGDKADEVKGGIGVGELQECTISKMSDRGSSGAEIVNGHGTHVAGTIGAMGNNG
jgi:subtilisin family serine protease